MVSADSGDRAGSEAASNEPPSGLSRRSFVGADRDGRLAALVHESVAETSGYEDHTDSLGQQTRMLYACPNVRTRTRIVPLDVSIPTYMRAPGNVEAGFALDELADQLGVDRVSFRLGRSELPAAPQHGGSQTMASVGSAVLLAGAALREWAVRLAVADPASPLHGAAVDQVAVADGQAVPAHRPEGRRDLPEAAGPAPGDRAGGAAELVAEPGVGPVLHAQLRRGLRRGRVDEALGLVRIRRMFGTYDAGRVVNPGIAHGQAVGGMVGVAAAVTNAIHHATGRRGRELPVRLEKLL